VEARVRPGDALEAGLFLRGSHAGSDRYDAILLRDGRLQIRRLLAGRPTVLAEVASGVADRTAFTLLALQATGAGPVQLVASVNGAPRLSATDASSAALPAAGHGGLWTYSAGVRFDDFAVRTAPAP
jgi:hypothetical protein